MAKWDELTDEQRQDIQTYDSKIRGAASGLSKMAVQSNPVALNSFAEANVDPYVSTLDPGEIIPHTTGLADAKDLTVEEFLALQHLARTVTVLLSDNIDLITKAVGVNAR